MVKLEPKWEPWKEFDHEEGSFLGEALPVEEPPCKYCACWQPRRQYKQTAKGPVFDGVRLCWSTDRHGDFSCFVSKDEK